MFKLRRILTSQFRLSLCLAVCAGAVLAASLRPNAQSRLSGNMAMLSSTIGKVQAKGAFTSDFAIPGSVPFIAVVPGIERDRMYMAARPGMQNKYLPFRIDLSSGNFLSGGRYLFDTEHDAEAYKNWVRDDFILDGIHFWDRPAFINPVYQWWRVVEAYNFGEIQTRIFVRTERWSVPKQNQVDTLKQEWSAIRAEAAQRGLTSVWLLYNDDEQLVQLVYFADRIVPYDPNEPDFVSLAALENSEPLGHHFDHQDWVKTFDRTHWVLTIWFPFVVGDNGAPSLWPHSPPLPEPYCGDGVCEVSRGENHTTCPGDCPPAAGDGVCDLDESSLNCPGDCPPQ